MIIKWAEAVRHPGGLIKLTAVVKGDISKVATIAEQAARNPDKYELTIGKVKVQRGQNANSYYWKLVDQIASVLNSTKQEIHTQLLSDYGTFKTDENGEIVTLLLKDGTDPSDLVKYAVFLSAYANEFESYNVYGVCKGSSEMTSQEFSKLLDGAIYEAKGLGIEVLSDIEIKRMVDLL